MERLRSRMSAAQTMSPLGNNRTSWSDGSNATIPEGGRRGGVFFSDLLFLSACFSVLMVQTHIIVSYLKSKPPGLTSLSDLINLDLARTLFLGCAALVACHLVIALNLRLPPYASFALVGSMQVLVHGVMFYLSIGAVVQFAHVYLKSVSLSETVSDETIQGRVRFTIGFVALAINLWGATDSRPSLLELLMTADREEGSPEQEQQEVSKRGVVITLVLSLLCAVTNLALRTFIQIRKREPIVPQQHQQQRQQRHQQQQRQQQKGQQKGQQQQRQQQHQRQQQEQRQQKQERQQRQQQRQEQSSCSGRARGATPAPGSPAPQHPEQVVNHHYLAPVAVSFGIYILFALSVAFVCVTAFLLLGRSKSRAHLAPTNVAMFVLCVLFPAVLIRSDRKMRAFARKRLVWALRPCCCRCCPSSESFPNQVAPA